MIVCYCGYSLDGPVHRWSRSKWCFPDEPETLDQADDPNMTKEE